MNSLQVTSRIFKFHFGQIRNPRFRIQVSLGLVLLLCLLGTSSRAGSSTAQLQGDKSSLSFGNVAVGQSATQQLTYKNVGTASATITGVIITGYDFGYAGPKLPVTVPPGQSVSLTIRFRPDDADSSNVTLKLSTNATVTPSQVSLSGTGVQPAPSISVNPATLAFGNILVGSNKQMTVSISNPGKQSLSLSKATLTGTGFTMSGLTTPLTLAAGKSSSFTVTFHPAVAAVESGSISLSSNAPNSPFKISLSGTGTQPLISVVPSPVSFGNVSVGLTNTQTVAINNSGTGDLTVTQSAGPGTGFSVTGLALPMTVAPGKSATFTLSFHPASSGSQTSSVVLVSNAPASPTTVSVSGTGTAAVNQISSSASSLSFGTDLVGTTTSQNVTLTNTGTVNVTISQINVAPTSFKASGLTFPLTLSAGETAGFSLSFTPAAAGAVTGTASVISTATDSPLSISLAGAGTSQTSHSVVLDWTASTSSITGYFVYSGNQTGGPYSKVNSTPVSGTTFTDSSVQAGQTYYYVATAVDSAGVESAYSNQVSAAIP
jgi:hypothetical protein